MRFLQDTNGCSQFDNMDINLRMKVTGLISGQRETLTRVCYTSYITNSTSFTFLHIWVKNLQFLIKTEQVSNTLKMFIIT